MKIKFTKREMYESYMEDVVNVLVLNYEIPYHVALIKINDYGLKSKFMNDLEMFEFAEPSKVARLIMKEEN